MLSTLPSRTILAGFLLSLSSATAASYAEPIDLNADGKISAAEIQSVLNATTGTVFLPAANTYELETSLTMSNANGVSLLGEGIATVLQLTGNFPALLITNGTGCAIRELKIQGPATHTQNAITITGGNEHAVQNLTISGTGRGVEMINGIGPIVTNVVLDGIKGAFGIKADGTTTPAVGKVDAAQFHDITGTTTNANLDWFLIGRVDGAELYNVTVTGGKRGLRAYGTSGPKYVYTQNVQITNPAIEGIRIETGNDVLINNTQIENSGGTAVVFAATFTGGAVLTDLTITNSAGHGIHIAGGRDIGILEPVIHATGSIFSTSNDGAGIRISGDTKYVRVVDGTVHGQRYGVHYTGTTTDSDDNGVKIKNVNVASNTVPFSPANLEDAPHPTDVIIDNVSYAATRTGAWTLSTAVGTFHGANFLHDGNTGSTGGKSVRFTPSLQGGTYEVFAHWPKNVNRATNTPFDITHASGITTVTKDQKNTGDTWISLGTYTFTAGASGHVTIRNDGANGFVIADAIKFVRQ